MTHCVSDVDEVFPEFAGNVFVAWFFSCEFESDSQKVQGVHRHPAGAIRLFNVAASRQRSATIEHANVVESEKASLEDVHATSVFSVHPPGEVEHEFVEDALQECSVTLPLTLFVDLINAPGGPGVDGRIDVAECPFVSRNLSVGVHLPLAQHQSELLSRDVAIQEG